jgi:predicted ester cyclase
VRSLACTAKYTRAGLGIQPTGKTIRVTGITIFRVAGGKNIEAWQTWDMLGLMEQIQGAAREGTYIAGA